MFRAFALSILCFLAFTSQGLSAGTPMVISGYDDVLRQSDNTGLLKAVVSYFEPDRTFSGMRELYVSLLGSNGGAEDFFVVSAAPTWIEGRVQKFLSQSGFLPRRIYLRNWLSEGSIENFKLSKIELILRQHPGRSAIVFLDDSGPSLAVAQALRVKSPSPILAVYLRQVRGRSPSTGVRPFFTAFDIALPEYQSGRMSADGIKRVGQAIMSEKDSERILPPYASCPKTFDLCLNLPNELLSVCSQVESRVRKACAQRS